MRTYRILLEGRNQGLIYSDASGVYRFNISREGKVWRVHLPPTKGESFAAYPITPQEQELLFPRIRTFLSRIWWLGIWPINYEVQFDSLQNAKHLG